MTNSISSTLSSPGVGSGLDVSSLVSSLVSAARATPDKLLSAKTSAANSQISAFGMFKSALSALKTSMAALSSSGTLNTRTAQSSDTTVFTASADSTAVTSSYGIEVITLATAAKAASTPYASSSTSVGEGTVTVQLGAESFDVTLTAGADSLNDLVSAINTAADNPGVQASIVTDVDGAHLVLTSTLTGSDHALSVSSALTAGGAPFLTMNPVTPAGNAHIKVDGFDVYSQSNTVTTAISGLTVNLVKAAPGTSLLLTSSVDNSAVTKAVQNFVTNYNAVIATVATLTKADPSGNATGPLVGDVRLRSAANQLRGLTGGTITGTGSQWNVLSQLGITANTDGTLKLDTAKLGTALSTDLSSVQKLFSDTTHGLTAKIGGVLDTYLQTGGTIETATTSLQTQLKDVTKQKDQLNQRMDALQARYLAQFSALDTLIAGMKQTSSYLTQQLANLPGFTTDNNR